MLEIEDLRVSLPAPVGVAHALRGIDLHLAKGETLGLVGESGCGKSMTALAVLNLLPAGARRSAARLSLNGTDLRGLRESGMRDLRGRAIGMVFQDPSSALNPVQTIGHQMTSVRRRHFGGSARAARDRAVDLLERVGIRGAAGRLAQYPHQLSGGLKQRVLIALGHRPLTVLFGHALRNAILPVVSVGAVQAGFMLGGSIVVETVFALQGTGYLAWEAIAQNDYPVVQAVVLTMSAIFVLTTLAADLLNAALDPRIALGS